MTNFNCSSLWNCRKFKLSGNFNAYKTSLSKSFYAILCDVYKDRSVDLLIRAYQGNLGPLLIIKRDRHIAYRLRKLMEYVFETCFQFGEVLLSKDGYACICLLYSDKKRTTLKSICQTVSLIFQAIGLRKLPSVLRSERIRQQVRPKKRYAYGWLIGVDPSQ